VNKAKFIQSLINDLLDLINRSCLTEEDRIYTLLAFKFIMENKEEGMYGKISIPLQGGETKDPQIEKKTIKFETYYRELLGLIE